MSEHDNLNIVKDTYVAYRKRNIPALLNCLADDVKWFSIGPPDIIPTAGTRHGRDQVEQYFVALDGMEEADDFEPGVHRSDRSRSGDHSSKASASFVS